MKRETLITDDTGISWGFVSTFFNLSFLPTPILILSFLGKFSSIFFCKTLLTFHSFLGYTNSYDQLLGWICVFWGKNCIFCEGFWLSSASSCWYRQWGMDTIYSEALSCFWLFAFLLFLLLFCRLLPMLDWKSEAVAFDLVLNSFTRHCTGCNIQ